MLGPLSGRRTYLLVLSASERSGGRGATAARTGVILALVVLVSGCSLGSGDDGPQGGRVRDRPVSVAGVDLYPLPAKVVDDCLAAQEEARIPVLCPTRLPRPTRDSAGASAPPLSSLAAFAWSGGPVSTGIDISYSAETGRPRLDTPDRFFHLQVIEQEDPLPPGARPATLGGKSGALAPASSRGYADEAYFANHLRFFWTEGGVKYAATLHNFGRRTRRLLEWLVAHLRPASELRGARSGTGGGRVEAIEVPVPGPVSVAVGQGEVWVTGQGDRSVSAAWLARIDPSRLRISGDRVRISRGGGASAVAVNDSVWVALRGVPGQAGLQRFDSHRGELEESIDLRPELVAVAPTEETVSALDFGGWPGDALYRGGAVLRADPAASKISARIPVGRAPADIASGVGRLWVTNNLDGTVSEIDPSVNRVVRTLRVGAHPTGVAVGYRAVWVANHRDGTISRIDPAKSKVVQTIRVGRGPRGVTVGERGVWVTNELDDTVSRIDPQSNRVVETIAVGAGPVDVAVGEGAVWVANLHDATVSRVKP